MPKANQKFTNTKKPKGKVTGNTIGNGKYSNPDDLCMIPNSQQYIDQMKRYKKTQGQ